MGIWSAIFKSKGKTGVGLVARAAGVLKDQDGWYYEESQNFSSTQSTIRVEQRRPGNWEVRQSACGIDDLNNPVRTGEVKRFFNGSYRWLRLERAPNSGQTSNAIKVIGTYRDAGDREHAVHLGFLPRELAEDLEGKRMNGFWGRIRFIKFPSPGRNSKYLVRFDLMENSSPRRNSEGERRGQ